MYRSYVKRIFDIVASLILLLILSPVFLIASFAVIISFGFPVIFKQTREGKNKVPFTIYKFKIFIIFSLSFVVNNYFSHF